MACVAVNCKSYSNDKILRETTNISFHKFPKSTEIRKQWINAVRRANWLPTKHSKICSKHFEPSCFIDGVKYRVLRTDAIPTIFEGHSYISESTKFDQQLSITREKSPEPPIKKKIHLEDLNSVRDIDLSVTKVCCTCLSYDIEMFSLTHHEIRKCFEKVITNIKIELEHELLQNVCAECVLTMRKFVTFKEGCLESNQRLRQILMQSNHANQDPLKKERQIINSETIMNLDHTPNAATRNVKQENITDEESVSIPDLENTSDNFDSNTDHINGHSFDDVAKLDPNFDDVATLDASFDDVVKLEHSPLIIIVEEMDDLDIQYDGSSVNSKLIESYKVDDRRLNTCDPIDEAKVESKGVEKTAKINRLCNLLKKEKLLRKGQTAYAVRVSLTKKQQIEDFLKRETSESYLKADFKCCDCLTGFVSKEKIEQHMQWHDERRAWQCDVCKLRFCNLTRLRLHQATHKDRYKCLTCGEISKSQKLAMRHYNRHVRTLPSNTCKICNKTFQYGQLYKRHIRTAHPTDYVCDVCGDYFTSRFHLATHQRHLEDCRKPPINIIECRRCDAHFLSVNTWYSHMLAHSDEPDQIAPKDCQVCGRETGSWKEWSFHVSSEHRNKNIDRTKIKQRRTVQVQCNVCGKMLKKKTSLTQHIQRKHEETVTNVSSNEKSIYTQTCEVCNKTLLRQNMRRHMIIHTGEKPYACSVCGKCYNQAVTRDEHIKFVHERTKTRRKPTPKIIKKENYLHKCETCTKQFASKSYLMIHLRKHTGEKPFSCDVCHEKFITKVHLQIHQSIHTGEMHSCDLCDRKYANKDYLRLHMKKHTGEKPFACDICGMQFLHKSNMKRHALVHTGAKDFACEMCGKTFAQKSSMTSHINAVHLNIPYPPKKRKLE